MIEAERVAYLPVVYPVWCEGMDDVTPCRGEGRIQPAAHGTIDGDNSCRDAADTFKCTAWYALRSGQIYSHADVHTDTNTALAVVRSHEPYRVTNTTSHYVADVM